MPQAACWRSRPRFPTPRFPTPRFLGSPLAAGAEGTLAVLQALGALAHDRVTSTATARASARATPTANVAVVSVGQSADGTLAATIAYGDAPSTAEVTAGFRSDDQ